MHYVYCVCRCRRATVYKQLWGDLANKNGPELTPETVVRVQLMMSVVMYMFVYVCVILVLMRFIPCHGTMYWWSVPLPRWVHNW